MPMCCSSVPEINIIKEETVDLVNSNAGQTPQDGGLSELEELAKKLEEVVVQLVAGYRDASRNPDTDPEMLRRVDKVTSRSQRALSAMRRYRSKAHSDEVDEKEAMLWEGMFTGQTKRFTSFASVIRRVATEAHIVKHWKTQSHHSTVRKLMADHEETLLPVDSWSSLDVFKVASEYSQPMTRVIASIWRSRNWDALLRAPTKSCLAYLSALEETYNKDNPYHNRIHAADVVQAAYYMLTRLEAQGNMIDFVSDLDFLVMVVAAAMHDAGHPALTNDFLVKSRGALALRYNDKSPLENFHAATGFELMEKHGASLVEHNLPSPRPAALRERIVDMILATDMALHKGVLENLSSQVAEQSSAKDIDKLVMEKAILHMADIGHPLRPIPVHQEFTDRVTQEFFAQGDLEKSLGFQPIALFDREKAPSLAKGQLGFLNFVVMPMWRALEPVFQSHCQELATCLVENFQRWEAQAAAEDAADAAEQSAPASGDKASPKRPWVTPRRSKVADEAVSSAAIGAATSQSITASSNLLKLP